MRRGKVKRREMQERPQKTYTDAIKDKMNQVAADSGEKERAREE